MSFTIYCHTSKTTGKRYVGWTSKDIVKRWKRHLKAARSGSEYYFHRAIRKYGADDWESTVLEIVESEVEAKLSEERWILQFASNDPERGYNSTSGGEASIPNDATRQRLSEAQRRRFQNPEEREKTSRGAAKRPPVSDKTRRLLSESKLGENNPQFGRKGENSPRYGKKHTDDTKAQIAEKKRGQCHSDETKRKCSEAAKRRWLTQHGIDQSQVETEDEIQSPD